jgi:hypothetical protein
MSSSLRSRAAHVLTRRFADTADRGRTPVSQQPDEASLAQYDRLLTDEAQVTDVPVDLLKAICWYASGWRQFEPGGRVLATPTPNGTTWGCMQLNDVWHPDAFPTAKQDAQGSIRYAATLLRWLYEQTGDWHRSTIAFFGHDRRAEVAARRVRAYTERRPWIERLPAPRPAAEPAQEPATEIPDESLALYDSL